MASISYQLEEDPWKLQKNQEKYKPENFYTQQTDTSTSPIPLADQKLLPPFTQKFLMIDITIPAASETDRTPVVDEQECRIHVDQMNFSSFGFSFPAIFGHQPEYIVN